MRIKEQETGLTLHERDDNDDDDMPRRSIVLPDQSFDDYHCTVLYNKT